MTLADQFTAGLERHQLAPPLLNPPETDEDRLMAVGLQAYAQGLVTMEYHQGLEDAVVSTESPIEQAMFWALLVASTNKADAVLFRSVSSAPPAPDVLIIEPQVKLGKYRADFVVTARSMWGFDDTVEAKVIVECDGHDFHERTKQQAQRDKSRDRALVDMGYAVLRFTGSEVYKDPLKCALEAIDVAQNAASRRRRES